MNSAAKVGEIFTAAGEAFNTLGELTMKLYPNSDTPTGKWTDEEIDMLHTSIVRFSDDLNKISSRMKNRTVSQIRQTLKKKAFEDAGIPAKQLPVQQQAIQATSTQQQQLAQLHNTNQQQPQQQMQTVHIQQVQQIAPVQTTSTTTLHQQQQHHPQPLQTPPKQIIIQPSLTTTTPQQTAPQIVHIQPQQLQQLQQLQTTTVTLHQFQQMQQQQKNIAATNTALASLPSTIVAPPTAATTIADNIMHSQGQKQLSSTPQTIVVANAAVAGGGVATSNNVATIVTTSGGTAGVGVTAASSTGLKCGPDVMMTLNRLNTQEHDEAEDVAECRLPSDVVKLDFPGEEVAG